MLQLHLNDQQFYCLLRCDLYQRFDNIWAVLQCYLSYIHSPKHVSCIVSFVLVICSMCTCPNMSQASWVLYRQWDKLYMAYVHLAKFIACIMCSLWAAWHRKAIFQHTHLIFLKWLLPQGNNFLCGYDVWSMYIYVVSVNCVWIWVISVTLFASWFRFDGNLWFTLARILI